MRKLIICSYMQLSLFNKAGWLAFVFLSSCIPGIGQMTSSYIPPSPNASSLGVFGDIPVSEYTGVPEISIPVYEIKSNGQTQPISLSYHSAGIRASEEASWVGMNWTLNCGGVVARTKRHKDDLGQYGFYKVPPGARPCSDNVDQEPDLFYYNVGGKSGKFIIDFSSTNGYVIRTLIKDNVKIEMESFGFAWIITTGDGTRYRLARTEYTTETDKTEGATTGTETYISSWFLTSIEPPDGGKIEFAYNVGPKILRTYLGYSGQFPAYTPKELSMPCCKDYEYLKGGWDTHYTTDVTTDEVVLKSIRFPNGFINFETSSRTDLQSEQHSVTGRKLDRLLIYKGTDENAPLFKEFDFNYDYYNSGSNKPSYITSRLRLRSVTEKSGDVSKTPYTFSYNSDQLPDKYTRLDYPGLGNYIGTQGLINLVKYPTGGKSKFDFEQTSYLLSDGSISTAGGARILRITAMDPDKAVNVKRYEYLNGRLMGHYNPSFSFYIPRSYKVVNCCSINDPNQYIGIIYRLSFDQDFSSFGEVGDGTLIGYDQVTTYYGENGENGKTVAEFINTPPIIPNYTTPGEVPYPVPVPMDVSHMNGLLKDSYVYSKVNDSYILLKRVHKEYTSSDAYPVLAARKKDDDCTSYRYVISTDWIQDTKQTVYEYDQYGNNPVIRETVNYYDNPKNVQPTLIQTSNSKGDILLTKYKYTQEAASEEGGVYSVMLRRFMINPVIEHSIYKNGILTGRIRNIYRDWTGNEAILKPEKVEYQKGGGDKETRLHYYSYDNMGNNLVFSKENDEQISYLWGYNGMFPIAEVKGAALKIDDERVPTSYSSEYFLPASGPQGAITGDLAPFTTYYPQDFDFRLIIGGMDGANTAKLRLRIWNSSGVIVYDKDFLEGGGQPSTVYLQPGSYTPHYDYDVFAPYPVGQFSITMRGTYYTPRAHPTIFFTSFEEDSGPDIITTGGRGGQKCKQGGYHLSMPWTAGKYIVSWWHKPVSGGSWVYSESKATITGPNAADYVIGDYSTLIDDVRVYPENALMSTYTYDPLIGMTSSCGPDNKIANFEYDNLGRLLRMRDQDGLIAKQYTYKYQEATKIPCGNRTSCTGSDQKCIDGGCEVGRKVNTGGTFVAGSSPSDPNYHGYYICHYHYEWSDGTKSPSFSENSTTGCSVTPGPPIHF